MTTIGSPRIVIEVAENSLIGGIWPDRLHNLHIPSGFYELCGRSISGNYYKVVSRDFHHVWYVDCRALDEIYSPLWNIGRYNNRQNPKYSSQEFAAMGS